MSNPIRPSLPLQELQRIRKWHLAHRSDHPLEYQLWDAVLTIWVMGWVGWLPTYALEAWWLAPLCALFMLMPQLYVDWRARAHVKQQLRCDWLPAP
jgi:hypothetical protein